jgi:hypothetical protein
MRRALVLMIVLGLVLGSVAVADAKKKPKRTTRTAEGAYDAPPLVVAGTCAQTGAVGCVLFATGADESYVTAKVTDQHGLPVLVQVSANTDGNTGDDVTFGSFCGETTEPIKIDPGVELHFWVGAASTAIRGCPPGIATSGTVSATFSNLP